MSVQVIRKDDNCSHGERMARPHLARSRAQHVNVLGEKSQPALGEIDREEVAPARHEVAPVICHLILAYRDARDGFRYAQPILRAAQAREPSGGLIVMPETFLNVHRAEVTSLAARYRLPTVYPWRFYTKLGGLLSYGIDLPDNYGRAAIYADRILKGAKPNELPVQAPVKLVLVINLKTAKELELEVPLSLLIRADELVE
jgi:ABC transporter substrate binding protein